MSRRFSLAIISVALIGCLLSQATEPPQERGYPLPKDVPLPERTDSPAPLAPGELYHENVEKLIPFDDPIGREVRQVWQASSVLTDFPTLGEIEPTAEARAARARAAEQLLKAARLLQNLGEYTPGREELTEQMRVEAGKLLSE
jgi:hypothetical protein